MSVGPYPDLGRPMAAEAGAVVGRAPPAMWPADTSNPVVPTGTEPSDVECRSTSARSTGSTEHADAVKQFHDGGIGIASPDRNVTSVLVNVDRSESVQTRVRCVTTR